MTRRAWSLCLSLLLLAMVLSGCALPSQSAKTPTPAPTAQTPAAPAPQAASAPARTVYPITVKDGAGRDVTISAEPKRIVSYAPSNSELVFALGKGSSLVGRSDFCDYPADVTKVTSIGGIMKPDYESVVALKPDLVLFVGGTVAIRDKLVNDYKLNVFVLDPQNFDQLYAGIRQLGQILDAQPAADKVVKEMQDAVLSVRQKVGAATAKPKVFYEVWHDPLMTAGPGTFIDDLIKLAGGVNAAADAKEPWPVYAMESLVANDPDIYLTSTFEAPNVKSRSGFAGLKAVKNGKVIGVEDSNLIVRPGPRLVLGLKWLAEKIHPDLMGK